jgi:predicted nucleic acid-binding protein
MLTGPTAFLVDTNVLVYAYDRTDYGRRARAVVVPERLAATRGGALSAQVLGEFFVVATRKLRSPLTAAEAERSLTHYTRTWPVLPIEASTVREAARGAQRFQLSYWDALIWATARLNDVPYVLSEDFSDGALLEGVRFLNPFAERFDLALLSR